MINKNYNDFIYIKLLNLIKKNMNSPKNQNEESLNISNKSNDSNKNTIKKK